MAISFGQQVSVNMPPVESFYVDFYPTFEGISDSVRLSLISPYYLLVEAPLDASSESVTFNINLLPRPSSTGLPIPVEVETEIAKEGVELDEILYNPDDFLISTIVEFGSSDLTTGSFIERIGNMSVEFKIV